MTRVVGRWSDEQLEQLAKGLAAEGVVCDAWRFLADGRVVVALRSPEDPQQVLTMSRVIRGIGPRTAVAAA